MNNENLEKMSTGDVAIGYVGILQHIVEETLFKLVEKNLITKEELKEIIQQSLKVQEDNISNIQKDFTLDSSEKERLSRIYELAIEKWSPEESSK